MFNDLISNFRVLDFVDILIVSFFIYQVLLWLRGSRAIQLIKGFGFIVLLFIVSKVMQLYTIEWLMEKLAAIIFIMLIVVFQPELRQAEWIDLFFRNINVCNDPDPVFRYGNSIIVAAKLTHRKPLHFLINYVA